MEKDCTVSKKDTESEIDENAAMSKDQQHPLFEVIKTSKPEDVIEAVRDYFEIDGVSIETLDSSGMTPLMHACWKGNVEFVKFLIKQGCMYDK